MKLEVTCNRLMPSSESNLQRNKTVLEETQLKNGSTKMKILKPKADDPIIIRLNRTDALNNRDKALTTVMQNHFDYSKENAFLEPKQVWRVDRRGQEIQKRDRATEMDKILNPKKEAYNGNHCEYSNSPKTLCEKLVERNRNGTLKNPSLDETPPAERCMGDDAFSNKTRHRGLGMFSVIGQSRDGSRSEQSRPRLGLGAEDNYELNKGGAMATLMNYTANMAEKYSFSDSAGRACPTAASKEQRERHRGVMGSCLRGELSGDPVHSPRVRSDLAKSVAEREGTNMLLNLTQYGKNIAPVPEKPRWGIGAESNAIKGRGQLTQQQYATKPDPARPPRQLGNVANNHQGRGTKALFHQYGKLPSDPQQKPRVPPGARKIANLSRGGGMADCVNPVRNYQKKRKPIPKRPQSAPANMNKEEPLWKV